MKFEDYELLLYLAKKKGLFGKLQTSTSHIASDSNVSQQTVSRKLRELENNKLITRQLTPHGMIISLTDKGQDSLKNLLKELKIIFTQKKSLTGIVEKGMGEGKYYMSIKQYQQRLKDALGYVPYPGTLNLNVDVEETAAFLSNLEPIEILGFETKERTYGGLICYKIKIKGTEGAIMKPVRTRHAHNIIEVISPLYLRGKFKIKDGDAFTVTS